MCEKELNIRKHRNSILDQIVAAGLADADETDKRIKKVPTKTRGGVIMIRGNGKDEADWRDANRSTTGT